MSGVCRLLLVVFLALVDCYVLRFGFNSLFVRFVRFVLCVVVGYLLLVCFSCC